MEYEYIFWIHKPAGISLHKVKLQSFAKYLLLKKLSKKRGIFWPAPFFKSSLKDFYACSSCSEDYSKFLASSS